MINFQVFLKVIAIDSITLQKCRFDSIFKNSCYF